MTQVAIVASTQDAQFARSIRDALREANVKGGAVFSSLGAASATDSPKVVLLWSADLDRETHAAGASIDVQELVRLWSDGRLVVVRRDETPLPLGMRDLSSLGRDSTPEDVGAIVARALGKELGLGGRKKGKRASLTIAILSLALGLGGWYLFKSAPAPEMKELMAALDQTKKANEALNQAVEAEKAAQKALADTRKAEEDAKARGDVAEQKRLAEETAKKEAELRKQKALVKQADAASRATLAAAESKKSQAEEAMKKTDASKKAEAEKAEADNRVAAEKAAVEKAAALEVAKAAAPAPKAAPPEPAKPKGTATMGTAERLVLREEGAARKAAEAAAPPLSLYEQGRQAEGSGNIKAAVRLYVRAVRAGEFEAAKALGDIFVEGKGDVPKDYAESLRYYSLAEKNGVKVERSRARGGDGAPEITIRPPAPKPSQPAPAVAPKPAPEPLSAPAPAPVTVPADSTESSPSPSMVLALVFGTLVVIVLWRRPRREPVPATPTPRPALPPAQAPADGTMLFVSYSHKDRQRIDPIVLQIEQMGRKVWMDRTDITGQAGWAGQIVRAIRECRAVVLMASPNSYGSDQVVRELYLAMNHKKPIVPIELEPAELPDELQYILAPFQHHRLSGGLSGGEARDMLGRALAAV